MGELRINLTNFLTVGLMAFVFLYVLKKAIELTGIRVPGIAMPE